MDAPMPIEKLASLKGVKSHLLCPKPGYSKNGRQAASAL